MLFWILVHFLYNLLMSVSSHWLNPSDSRVEDIFSRQTSTFAHKWPSVAEYCQYTRAADRNLVLINHCIESVGWSICHQMKAGATMAHTNTIKWDQWHASFNSFSSIKIIHQAEPSLWNVWLEIGGTLNPCPGLSIHLQHTSGLDAWRWTAEPDASIQLASSTFFKIIIVNTVKCMEPKIRQPHHNFTEAVRHPEPASNLERYGEQRRQRALIRTSQKQNICMILSVCMCVCVCVSDVYMG